MEAPILVPPQGNSSESQALSRSVKCDSRQALPAQSGNPDRVVTRSECVQSLVLEMGPTTSGSFCNPVQLQASQVCLTGSRPDCLGCGRPESTLAGSGCVSLPSCLPPQPSDLQSGGSGVSKDDSHCSRVAQHGVVLGPGQSVSADSIQSSAAEGSGDSTVQRAPSPRSVKSESACMAPRTAFIPGKGFSGEVAARIEVPQRRSTRAVYKSKWAIFVKWCEENKVDFRSPTISHIADFLFATRLATQYH